VTRLSHRASPRPRRARGSFLIGLAVGLLLGLGIALAVALFLNKTPIPFMGKGTKAATTEPARAVAGMPQGGGAPAPAGAVPPTAVKGTDKPKYDFYKILPGNEEPVSERELKEAARAAAKGQPEADKAVYFIQAGSFQNPADADNQKAKIAILGFESSVEPTNLPDKGTWYRVRLGPYTSLEDLNKVRRTLAQNGIDASLVKMKDVAAKAN